ncbi:hypothetical protein V6N13_032424 [Hibiscus sabdariffa]
MAIVDGKKFVLGFEVDDIGSGIDPSNKKFMFESIEQADHFVFTLAIFTLTITTSTGLGIIYFLLGELDSHWVGIMMAVSFDLIQEGQKHGYWCHYTCSHIGALKLGEEINGYAIWRCCDEFQNVRNNLIIMFSRYKDLRPIDILFRSMKERRIITWNLMLHGYTHLDKSEEASFLFQEMLVSEVEPNYVTIATILPLCARVMSDEVTYASLIAGYILSVGVAKILPDAFNEASPTPVASIAMLSVTIMEILYSMFQNFNHDFNYEVGFFLSVSAKKLKINTTTVENWLQIFVSLGMPLKHGNDEPLKTLQLVLNLELTVLNFLHGTLRNLELKLKEQREIYLFGYGFQLWLPISRRYNKTTILFFPQALQQLASSPTAEALSWFSQLLLSSHLWCSLFCQPLMSRKLSFHGGGKVIFNYNFGRPLRDVT